MNDANYSNGLGAGAGIGNEKGNGVRDDKTTPREQP